MKVLYENSFLKDIKRIRDQRVSDKLLSVIEGIKKTDNLSLLLDIKKLKGHPTAFRIRISDYRLGFFLENDHVIFVRFINRKDFYKSFPK
jgi:mRNA interferase RelE/StbE